MDIPLIVLEPPHSRSDGWRPSIRASTEMNRHKAEEATFKAELKAKTELDALYHNLDQYIRT